MESSVVLLLLFAPSTYSSLLMMMSDGALTFFVFVVLCVAVCRPNVLARKGTGKALSY
jgi:hypothetical protein